MTQKKPQIEIYQGVNIIVEPIINMGRQTGTRFSFKCNGLSRQAFTLEGAQAQIRNIQEVVPAPVVAGRNRLVDVTNEAFERNHAALRGDEDLKSATPFG